MYTVTKIYKDGSTTQRDVDHVSRIFEMIDVAMRSDDVSGVCILKEGETVAQVKKEITFEDVTG